jgi:hypothetical protein
MPRGHSAATRATSHCDMTARSEAGSAALLSTWIAMARAALPHVRGSIGGDHMAMGANPVLIGDAQRTRRWPVLHRFHKHPCLRGLRISQFSEAH